MSATNLYTYRGMLPFASRIPCVESSGKSNVHPHALQRPYLPVVNYPTLNSNEF